MCNDVTGDHTLTATATQVNDPTTPPGANLHLSKITTGPHVYQPHTRHNIHHTHVKGKIKLDIAENHTYNRQNTTLYTNEAESLAFRGIPSGEYTDGREPLDQNENKISVRVFN